MHLGQMVGTYTGRGYHSDKRELICHLKLSCILINSIHLLDIELFDAFTTECVYRAAMIATDLDQDNCELVCTEPGRQSERYVSKKLDDFIEFENASLGKIKIMNQNENLFFSFENSDKNGSKFNWSITLEKIKKSEVEFRAA